MGRAETEFKMTEIPLPALDKTDTEKFSPMKQIDVALKSCTVGRFHVLLLVAAFCGSMAANVITASTGYILPVAECDLHMSLVQKGLLNAMPYIGMLLSTVIGGFLTDAFGRKVFLVGGFTGQFIFTFMAGSSQTYEVLLIAKFFEGLFFATCYNPLIAIATEFSSSDIRDRIVLLQSSFTAIGQVITALMSWGILITDWNLTFFGGTYVLNTWNFYLYAMSLCPLASCVMYGLFVPESPKYLVTQEKYDEARDILIKIYVQNTGKPADTYPCKDIWKETSKLALHETSEKQNIYVFKDQIRGGLNNVKPMFQKPLVIYLALICISNFIVLCMYNVFRLWFPQLSAIVEHYETDDVHDLCVMLDAYTNDLRTIKNATQLDVCVPTKSGNETYINSIIIGCASIVPYLISGILVKKVGKKRLLIAAGLLSVAGTISLRWASSTIAIVSLFSLTIAISQVMVSLNQALTVEVFGTTTRTLALSLMMLSGRIGTLTGNIFFPILLDMGCQIPFFTISGLMVCVTILSVFTPTKN